MAHSEAETGLAGRAGNGGGRTGHRLTDRSTRRPGKGYADASVIDKFTAESGCKLSATYVGSNDDFAPKLAAGGGVYDLMSGVVGCRQRAGGGGLRRADRSGEGGTLGRRIYEVFRTTPGINYDGKVWGVPLTWGANPFMYRTDKIAEEPTSIAALWPIRSTRARSACGTTRARSTTPPA